MSTTYFYSSIWEAETEREGEFSSLGSLPKCQQKPWLGQAETTRQELKLKSPTWVMGPESLWLPHGVHINRKGVRIWNQALKSRMLAPYVVSALPHTTPIPTSLFLKSLTESFAIFQEQERKAEPREMKRIYSSSNFSAFSFHQGSQLTGWCDHGTLREGLLHSVYWLTQPISYGHLTIHLAQPKHSGLK